MSIVCVADPREVVRYLSLRRRITTQYGRTPLDQLLRGADATAARRRDATALIESIRVAEMLAPRLGLRPDTCLFRALTRFALLRRGGHPATFCMGLHPDDAAEGHAWVELGGCGVLEPIPHELVTTYRYP